MAIETLIIKHLEILLRVPVYAERPLDPIPEHYIIVDKTGGSTSNHIERATVAIQSYAPSKASAMGLNEAAVAAMRQMLDVPEVSSVEKVGDYPFPASNTKDYRYQAVFTITYKEAPYG